MADKFACFLHARTLAETSNQLSNEGSMMDRATSITAIPWIEAVLAKHLVDKQPMNLMQMSAESLTRHLNLLHAMLRIQLPCAQPR